MGPVTKLSKEDININYMILMYGDWFNGRPMILTPALVRINKFSKK